MPRYEFILTGRTPLLLHNDDVDAADDLAAWRKDPNNKNVSKPGDDRSPAWSWLSCLYTDGKQVVVPGDNLASCLRQAGARVSMKGQKTFKESAVSGIWIEDEFLPIVSEKKTFPLAALVKLHGNNDFAEHVAAVKAMGFELFKKRAPVGGKAKHVRVRPRFNLWSLNGTLDVSAQEITTDVLRRILDEAGKVGLGDWRPGCKTPGRFGMFAADVKPIK